MRLLHTMLRVGNLQRSIEFYTKVLNMQLIRKSDNQAYRYSVAFVGYGPEIEHCLIELTYNWDTDQYDHGNAFGHIAIACADVYATCAEIKCRGGIVSREGGPVKGGTSIIAFVKDPDGYSIELCQRSI